MFQPEDSPSPAMRRRYLIAIALQAVVLAALWALGRIYA
jgi:hypothetical protein